MVSIPVIVSVIIFVIVYVSICYYIALNIWAWLKSMFNISSKKWFIIGFVLLAGSTFWSQLLSPYIVLHLIGYYWLVFFGYSLLLLPIANLIVIVGKRRKALIRGTGWAVVVLFIFIFGYGSYNAWSPVIRNYDIVVEKELKQDELKILMVTDLHLGPVVGNTHLNRLVKIVSDVEPDMVLLSGDIINDTIKPYINQNMGELMQMITAPIGVFASTGNHDYYGAHIELLHEEMKKSGVVLLEDEMITINDEIQIIGRKDFSQPRKPLLELAEELEPNLFTILLDHQPFIFEEEGEEALGIDLVLSGHTHRGQLVPGHLITNRLYEIDWGYLWKENSHIFVSSGFGTWGPPLRIGSRSEVIVIDVKKSG